MPNFNDEHGDLFGGKDQLDILLDRIKALEIKVNSIEKEISLEKSVEIKKLHPNALIPQYQKEGDAGFDFHALIDNTLGYIVVEPKSQYTVPTGVSCSIPNGYEIQIRPRSGLAFKYQITVTNSPGTLDSLYRNEIMVIIYNLSNQPFKINNGDRIAQGVLAKVYKADFKETEILSGGDRGGGLGSTGTN